MPRRGDPSSYRTVRLSKGEGFELRALPPGAYKIFAIPGTDGVIPTNPRFVERYDLFAQTVVIQNGVTLTGILVPFFPSAP